MIIGTNTNYYGAVFEFMAKHRQPVMRYPSLVPPELADFRIRLIEEELNELKEAIGSGNLTLIADALADLKYVIFGADVTFGLPADSIFEEVHRSNMSKELIKVVGNEMKVGKGLTYSAPRIRPILDACIRLGEQNDRERAEADTQQSDR